MQVQIQGNKASADQDYFLSLGAGHHQVPLIEAAIRKGLSVIAVDKNPLADLSVSSATPKDSRGKE